MTTASTTQAPSRRLTLTLRLHRCGGPMLERPRGAGGRPTATGSPALAG